MGRFSDLYRIEIGIFLESVCCNIVDVPVELQLELIDLQQDDLLEEKYIEKLADDEFSKMKKFTFVMTSVIGTTYVYEQTFSQKKYVNSA